MVKKLTATALAAIILHTSAFASVIGTEFVKEKSYSISDGTVLYENQIMSDQEGVGLQSEYYAEYTPNEDTLPVVINGEKLYGKLNANEAAEYMKEQGLRPMLGINASYFSLETGVMMGHAISGGRVIAKDLSSLRAVGFKADGTAIIAPLAIGINISTEEGDVDLENLNKQHVKTLSGISAYTRDFGTETANDAEVIAVTLDLPEEIKIGAEFETTVKSTVQQAERLPIGENEMILVINTDGGWDYHMGLINSLEEGESIKVSCTADGSEEWKDVTEAIASVGETLVEGGEVMTEFKSGAAPRTAVGITADGKVIFYAIDGRQKGHSYGLQLKSLAKRMAELGCVEAINLDGGGSTSISGVYPGADEIAVLNSPSDGVLRNVANFIFLKNTKEKTGVLKSIYTTPHGEKYLSGMTAELSSVGVDTAFYKKELAEVEYAASGESEIDGNKITLIGNGTVTITSKSGLVTTQSELYVYDEPDRIAVYADGEEIKELKMPDGATLALSAEAYVGSAKLVADESLFGFSLEGEVGRIEDNVFTARADANKDGAIRVTAGKTTVTIPVKVTGKYIFEDVAEHWARDMIVDLATVGAVNGYDTDEGLFFRPDNSITRGEFAVMLAGFMGIDTEEYKETESVFTDEIPSWAEPAVKALNSLGYVSGKETEQGLVYAPSDKITRAEVAAIIGRTLEFLPEETELAFSDSADVPEWAKSYVARLAAVGVISGYEDNTLRPTSNVTRAEAVTMLYKVSRMDTNEQME